MHASGTNVSWKQARLLVAAMLCCCAALAASTSKIITVTDKGAIQLKQDTALEAGRLYDIKSGKAFLGFLVSEKTASGVALRLLAGRAESGAEVIPRPVPTGRVGLLGGSHNERAAQELEALLPGRVVDLDGRAEAVLADLAAVVVIGPRIPPGVRDFTRTGGTLICDLAPYAMWRGVGLGEAISAKELQVTVTSERPATRGLGLGQRLAWFGKNEETHVCRVLESVPAESTVLLALEPDGRAVAIEETIGSGHILALDLLSPNGAPGHDKGSVLKWVLPGNLLCRSTRYTHTVSRRLKYDGFLALQHAVAKRVGPTWVHEPIGKDSGGLTVFRFRTGPMDRPTVLLNGAMHSGEWLNPYLLLDFVEHIANLPEDDWKTRWFLEHFTLAVIPMLSGSLRQESSNGCDLNRNFDCRWDDYTRGYGWRKGKALKLRGTAPFSEPESRIIRDQIWNHPVIGFVDMHMHGIQHGALFWAPHKDCEPKGDFYAAAAKTYAEQLRDRFLWKGPTQLGLRYVPPGRGRLVPYANNWAAFQGLWAISTELIGGTEHSLQEKELGFEALFAFIHTAALEFSAGKRTWLGYPRCGMARPGGARDGTAMVFSRNNKQVIAYRNNRGKGTLSLPLAIPDCRLEAEDGTLLEWNQREGEHLLPMDTERRFFSCGQADRVAVLDALRRATYQPRLPVKLFVPAITARRFLPPFTHGIDAGLSEEGAISSDVLVCLGNAAYNSKPAWYAEYSVDLPHEGTWAIWARVRYPSGKDDSFGFVPNGVKAALQGDQVLGNCGRNDRKWHWTARGGGSTSLPPGTPLCFRLPKGTFTFRVYARETSATPALTPRLDMLALTDDPAAIPTDAEAREAIAIASSEAPRAQQKPEKTR
ncbi:MAG: hypothetical protein HN742_03880 [Lentisphaerae bacterium]|jgi:hypothetical protein|nr:hypothetical protein [Lentisphaerota bacterium]MBT4820860.1 hypothetical protein [Lentisphaerota bacterium]MBT5607298.1 hypothetical protein [Lentisphaerota bacterium]MBT7055384.1 hypothetical protein [Lentisphaerota bacterium]MBT7840982.1 hypothetical protein [Lentisphaerota bacterium]